MQPVIEDQRLIADPRESAARRTADVRRRPHAVPHRPICSRVGYMANLVRERLHGNKTFFNVNRHINPTDVCVASCKLCAFGKQAKDPEGLHDVARGGLASRGRGLVGSGHRVSHRRRAASGADARLVLRDAARAEAALPAGAPEGVHDGGDRVLRAARPRSPIARSAADG